MARINTNVGAVTAQRNLNSSYRALGSTLERLSTGLRINRGKDDPAGLIMSERLRAEVSAVGQAISNTQRASNIIATTEGALNEVAALLTDIQDLIVEAANSGALSDDEIRANQLQVDSAIESITRIANTTTFAGRALLNGSLDYITSGVDTSVVQSLTIHGAQFGTRSYVPVNVEVLVSAQTANLYFGTSAVSQSVTIELMGNDGVTTLSFVSGTAASAVAAAVNAVSDATGVEATLSSDASRGFVMSSKGYGSKEFVSVSTLPGPGAGTFTLTDDTGVATQRDEGRDATAVINGGLSIGDGNNLVLKTSTLDLQLGLADSFGLGTTSFAITEGGALFQVGPQVNSNLQIGIGVQSVAASGLGNTAVGFLSQVSSSGEYALPKGKAAEAQAIVTEAINQVSIMRGRLGAFEKNTLDTNVSQLSITMENLMSAESNIRDADFAFETSRLTRNQILVQSGTSVLALANQTPQTVLQLLGG
ncbi:MAG: flagellin [Planctomycetes bacterium]|nr:flagellin [Planctomycetota bacterium]